MRLRVARLGTALMATAVVLAGCEGATKPPPAVNSVVVGPGLVLLSPGATQQYGAVVSASNGARLENRTVTWSIDDSTVATVSATGLVTARPNPTNGDRTTTVRATVEGKVGSAQVAVRPSAAASVQISAFTSVLSDGQAPQLTAVVRDSSNNILVGRSVVWNSRDLTTARITSAGVLTPVAFLTAENRTVVIVATSGLARDSITVTVAPSELDELLIFPRSPYVQAGWTKTLRVEGRTPGGSTVTGISATYTSSNTGVATVTSGGLVSTGPGSSGSTQIIANFGAFADTVTLTVDNCGAAPAGTYPLDLRFYGANPPSPSVEAAFSCAANRIRAIIRSPVAPTQFSNTNIQGCIGEAQTLTEVSEGLIIYAKVDSIDGPGQVLGSAGPCFVRSTSRIPVLGVMQFDNADLAGLEADGRLLPVILHEMLHVIGIGTSWRDTLRVPLLFTRDVPNPGFTGPRAIASCVNDHGGGGLCVDRVPIEDCVEGVPANCGLGTRLGHWREFNFDNELMTGYIEMPGVRNPFSRMTIEALADLGYSVDSDQSNDYFIPGAMMAQLRAASPGPKLAMPEPRMPTHEIGPMGVLRPLRPNLR